MTAIDYIGRLIQVDEARAAAALITVAIREIALVPGPSVFQYEHDFAGKLTKLTYPDGFWVEYRYYPGSGLLHTVTGSNGVQFARYEDYTPQGKIGAIYYGNGTSTTYTYDSTTKRLNHIQTLGSDRKIVQDRRYTYNKIGDLKTMELGPVDGYHLFSYDKMSRLISVDGIEWGFMRYEYDMIGNITKREIYNTLSTEPYRLYEYEYGPEKPHAVKSVTINGLSHSFTYDETGNIVYRRDLSNPGSPPERWINFNCFNKPKEVYAYSAGLTRKSSFVYDGDKKRVLKTVHAGSGRFTPIESDTPVVEDLEYDFIAADPLLAWGVEPDLQSSP